MGLVKQRPVRETTLMRARQINSTIRLHGGLTYHQI